MHRLDTRILTQKQRPFKNLDFYGDVLNQRCVLLIPILRWCTPAIVVHQHSYLETQSPKVDVVNPVNHMFSRVALTAFVRRRIASLSQEFGGDNFDEQGKPQSYTMLVCDSYQADAGGTRREQFVRLGHRNFSAQDQRTTIQPEFRQANQNRQASVLATQ